MKSIITTRKSNSIWISFLFSLAGSLLISCTKQDEWLNIKSKKGDITPSTLKNYQALLDYNIYMNDGYPGLPLVSGDNYFLDNDTWQGMSYYDKYAYIWDKDIYHGFNGNSDWEIPYIVIEYANVVLDGLGTIGKTPQNELDWNNAKGSAMFYRAHAFYNLSVEFTKAYNSITAAKDLGIPIRLTSDINVKGVRGTVEQEYQQILKDLKEAEPLLPNNPLYQSRPCKPAAEALLARVYLNMDQYDSAMVYAEKALQANATLIDFNTLNLNASNTFPSFGKNKEVIFYAMSNVFSSEVLDAPIDTLLYRSYAANDLRKKAFFDAIPQGYSFKGNYTGEYTPFGGIAVNELYMIAAECYARKGNKDEALQKLNALLVKRWKTGTFVPYTAVSADDALTQVLAERRKELFYSGSLRWVDLKRLNKDSRFAITLKRILNGQTYTLAPNDNRYVIPIPDRDIQLGGLEQNPR